MTNRQLLKAGERQGLLATLKARFEDNRDRHPKLNWVQVDKKLAASPTKLYTYAGLGDEVRPLGASPSATFCQPGPIQERGLTRQQQELAPDIAQITLDIVGIFEPTPFADGTSALISLGRGDWLGAGLSGISIIPYIGDLAKAGKLPSYSQKIFGAIQLARHNAEFAKYLKPVLERLKKIIDAIPVDLSADLADMINTIKRPLDDYLGGAKLARHLSLTERLVLGRMGSIQNIGALVLKNIEIAKDYFLRHGVPESWNMIRKLSSSKSVQPRTKMALRDAVRRVKRNHRWALPHVAVAFNTTCLNPLNPCRDL